MSGSFMSLPNSAPTCFSSPNTLFREHTPQQAWTVTLVYGAIALHDITELEQGTVNGKSTRGGSLRCDCACEKFQFPPGSLRTRGSGNELLTVFLDDDQSVHRTDIARIDQPVPVNVGGILCKGADILLVEFEDLRRNFHAVRRADAERTINADRQTTNFSFDEIPDDDSSLLPTA